MNPAVATFALVALAVLGVALDLPGLHVTASLAAAITAVMSAWAVDGEVAA